MADLKKFVASGDLRELGGTCSLNDIGPGEDWPDDLINIEFEDNWLTPAGFMVPDAISA